MKYNLFLDDCRTVLGDYNGLPWKIARNYEEFQSTIKEHGMPVYTSFDHDLGKEAALYYYQMKTDSKKDIDYEELVEKTGRDCLVHLLVKHTVNNGKAGEEVPDQPVLINFHSHNKFGIKAMKQVLLATMDANEYVLTEIEHAYKSEGHLMPLRKEDFITGNLFD